MAFYQGRNPRASRHVQHPLAALYRRLSTDRPNNSLELQATMSNEYRQGATHTP